MKSGGKFDRSEEGDTFPRWRGDDGSRGEKSRLRACKLLHIFSIIFLKFPVRSRDLPFLSPHQTSRRLVRQGETSLRDRLDTFHSLRTASFPFRGIPSWDVMWVIIFGVLTSLDHSLGFNGMGET